MRIGILSDTHGRLPGTVIRALQGIDQIVHCGDVGDPAVLDELEEIAPVVAVRGNCDGVGDEKRLPLLRVEQFGGVVFAVTHGHLVPNKARRSQDLIELFRERRPKVICYGHSHVYAEDWVEGTLLLNPGAVHQPKGDGGPTVAIVTLLGREPAGANLLVHRIALNALTA